jgi:hypothetical protein
MVRLTSCHKAMSSARLISAPFAGASSLCHPKPGPPSDTDSSQAMGWLNAVLNRDTQPNRCFRRSEAIGGRNRVRTCDPLLVRQVLYH